MFTELIENETTKKHRAEAEAVGLVLAAGVDKDSNLRMYRFTKCGHEQIIEPASVRKKQFRCNNCLMQKHKDDAEIVGLTLLDTHKGNFRNYKFNSCGHTQELRVDAVKEGRFECKTCQVNQFEIEAAAIGIVFMGDPKNKNNGYRRYMLQCGHETDARIANVRDFKLPTCKECGNNHFSKQSYLYIVEFTKGGNVAMKLGTSNKIETRTVGWACKENVSFRIKSLWLCHSKLDLLKIEKHIHSKSGIPRLSPEEGKEFVGSGFTEFYSTDRLNELIQAASDPKHGLLRLQ